MKDADVLLVLRCHNTRRKHHELLRYERALIMNMFVLCKCRTIDKEHCL